MISRPVQVRDGIPVASPAPSYRQESEPASSTARDNPVRGGCSDQCARTLLVAQSASGTATARPERAVSDTERSGPGGGDCSNGRTVPTREGRRARASGTPDRRLFDWLRGSATGLAVLSVCVGIGAGLGAIAFRYLIQWFTIVFTGYADYSAVGRARHGLIPALGAWFVLTGDRVEAALRCGSCRGRSAVVTGFRPSRVRVSRPRRRLCLDGPVDTAQDRAVD